MAMTIDSINCPGWHLAEGDIIVYTFQDKSQAVLQGVELAKTSDSPVGVYNAAGAIVWGQRPERVHTRPASTRKPKARRTSIAVKVDGSVATATGAKGCSKGRLAKAAAKVDMAVDVQPDGIPYLYFVKGEYIGNTIAVALMPGRTGYQELLEVAKAGRAGAVRASSIAASCEGDCCDGPQDGPCSCTDCHR